MPFDWDDRMQWIKASSTLEVRISPVAFLDTSQKPCFEITNDSPKNLN